MKLGVIGLGNMSYAILKGLKTSNNFDMNNIYASARDFDKLSIKCKELGIHACASNAECIENSDIIMVGVKPENLAEIARDFTGNDKPIISIAAKTPFAKLEEHFGKRAYIRVMPNLNVSVLKGTSAISYKNTSEESEVFVTNLFDNLGEVFHLDESQFSGFIGLAGSSPAIIFRLIHDIAASAMSEGFAYDEALEIAASAVEGSANYLANASQTPLELVSMVSSKKGTTVEGLYVLDNHNFDQIINESIQAIIKKDKMG